jgi:regulator-associated protein of mTOR
MKTVSAALVMCLNIGVDPPDVIKTSHSSKLECWISKHLKFFKIYL